MIGDGCRVIILSFGHLRERWVLSIIYVFRTRVSRCPLHSYQALSDGSVVGGLGEPKKVKFERGTKRVRFLGGSLQREGDKEPPLPAQPMLQGRRDNRYQLAWRFEPKNFAQLRIP